MSGGMSNLDRAKQFAPFAALRGLEHTIWESNTEKVERSLLTEDSQAELDQKLRALRTGDAVTVEYYTGQRYGQLSGSFRKIDLYRRLICIGEQKLPLDDIRDVWRDSGCL